MVEIIEQHRAELEALCRKHHVRRLSVFGSAVRDDFDPARSDLDFVVEFDENEVINGFASDYWLLQDALRSLFAREIDLVEPHVQRNPYFIRELRNTSELVYAA
jgi:predicted nucleotidyltransferase